MDQTQNSGNSIEPIVVYMIKRHPLETMSDKTPFCWLHTDNGYQKELSWYIGLFDPNQLCILIDERPAGPAWIQLIDSLLSGKIHTIITHLAPLTSGQRQKLIGICAQYGVRLVTPGDGGRNTPPLVSSI